MHVPNSTYLADWNQQYVYTCCNLSVMYVLHLNITCLVDWDWWDLFGRACAAVGIGWICVVSVLHLLFIYLLCELLWFHEE